MSTTSQPRYQNRRHSSSTTSSPTVQTSSVHTPFISMFHACQESAMLSTEFLRRNINFNEQKRHAEFQRNHLLGPPNIIPRLTNLPRQLLPTKIRLTMEVQSDDFASLYDGREAWTVNDSLSDIMRDTDCMVQFASRHDNESTELMGIFNQVAITGDIPNIDTAMNRIRAFCPITIILPLANLKDDLSQFDPANLVRQWCRGEELREFTKVQFSIHYPPNPFMPMQNDEVSNPSLVIRASRKDSKLMTQASEAICRLFFKESNPTFFAHLKIPVSQRKMIAGSPDGVLIRTISTQTNATIHYQNRSKSSATTSTSTNYYLSGHAGAVIQAVRALQDISPVRIEFEAENNHLLSPPTADIHREMDLFDIERAVIVQLRKSPYEGGFRLEREAMRHSLTLMTSEENVNNLYNVRQQLLVEACWKWEIPVKQNNKKGAQYVEYLKVLVMESSMRAYIGEGRVISVCRCKNGDHHLQPHWPPQRKESNEINGYGGNNNCNQRNDNPGHHHRHHKTHSAGPSDKGNNSAETEKADDVDLEMGTSTDDVVKAAAVVAIAVPAPVSPSSDEH